MSEEQPTGDTGLAGLVMLLRFHGIAADPEQIRRSAAIGATIEAADMLRCAKSLGLKARRITSRWRRLATTPLPAVARRHDGRFFILAKVANDKVLVQDPLAPQPSVMSRSELEAAWDGSLVLFTRRSGLSELSRRFDVGWFLQAMHKYRRLLGEVLVASLFLQLFALISPLFFQVVIDKVLVHRGLSTLDILVLGLSRYRCSKRFSEGSEPMSLPTPPTASMSNLGLVFFATLWRCHLFISRPGASAIRWQGCVNSRTSALSSPVRL